MLSQTDFLPDLDELLSEPAMGCGLTPYVASVLADFDEFVEEVCGDPKSPEIDKTFTADEAETPRKPLPCIASGDTRSNGTSVSKAFPSTPSNPTSSPSSQTPTPSKRRRAYALTNPLEPGPTLPGLRKRRGMKPYRDLNTVETFAMWDRAIEAIGERVAFTVNLRPDREAHYREQEIGTASAILKDVARHLKRQFNREVLVALALEETDEGRLHAHGIAGVGESEAEAFRAAVRAAVGEWESSRQFQTDTNAEIDSYWPQYCLKNRQDVRRTLDPTAIAYRLANRQADIYGKPIAASASVRRKAKDLYEDARSGDQAKDKSLMTYPVRPDENSLRNPLAKGESVGENDLDKSNEGVTRACYLLRRRPVQHWRRDDSSCLDQPMPCHRLARPGRYRCRVRSMLQRLARGPP